MLVNFPKLSVRLFIFTKRHYSIKNAPDNVIKFTNTINLPRTKFPPRLKAERRSAVQESIRQTCFSGLYSWQRDNLPPENEFILHDGPPYANGELHMGHAVNKILKDFILRHKIAADTRVHYIPGWDCHGLPIELKALDAYNKKQKGKTTELDAVKIRELARSFALETIDKQRAEFEQWGVTADWIDKSFWYSTLDTSYIKSQLRLFQELFDKGLIYRDLKPVFWSPSSRSALAEAELEYDEAYKSPSLYLKMSITEAPGCSQIYQRLSSGENVSAAIWTTTPWTLPANQAICFNPGLNYSLVRAGDRPGLLLIGSDLVPHVSEQLQLKLEKVTDIFGPELESVKYEHPLSKEPLPFLAANHVKAEKGTGLVHTAPAHGPDDFLVFLEKKMPIKSLVDEAGCYNDKSPMFLRGKFVLTEGNGLIMEYLRQQTLACGTIEHSYPIDWRTKKPVILRASDQWFINTDRLKDSALRAAEDVQIYPRTSADTSKKVLRSQLEKRPYWCISRQRAWGVPIPVVYRKDNMKPIVHSGIIENLSTMMEKTGSIDFWWTSRIEDIVPQHVLTELNLCPQELVRGDDILDIWFDSGVSWVGVLGKDRVADLYLEGLDQFTGWFQSSLLTSIAARGKSPYRSVFVHGFAVDENGLKMSKSLGNVISPKDIVSQYGCDTLRWWVAAHATQNTSIPVSQKLLASSAESVQKIRGIMKYLLGVIPNTNSSQLNESELYHVDRYFLQQLSQFHDSTFSLFNSYQYNRASASILTFCVSTLSGFYLHLIKDRLYCGTDGEYQHLQIILRRTFDVLCKVLWPIAPFLVEECWSYIDSEPFYKTSQQVSGLGPIEGSLVTTEIIEQALNLKRQVFQQQQHEINTWYLDVIATVPSKNLQLLRNVHRKVHDSCCDSELCEILQVGTIALRNSTDEQLTVDITSNKERQLCPRCRRFALSSVGSPVCQRCEIVLKEKSMILS
ncbi:isoleucine--tRNA ligase, mitochondrial [Toxorhynchites rutilus septentrionalis]|uniref:isoleucine--tRNA ligase, mitochondrial n=1 Tax=Toxorhynchites rutilus septentrionalis TaxID=329112 RepID=UPI00247848D5|nr:isoleucine--tRNA ligase, mitochondrial [Toxorhynchites rutilus septentrionalis]